VVAADTAQFALLSHLGRAQNATSTPGAERFVGLCPGLPPLLLETRWTGRYHPSFSRSQTLALNVRGS